MYGPSLPQGYQDFDLTEMTNQLFSRDIEKYDKKMGGFDSDEKFNTKLNTIFTIHYHQQSTVIPDFFAHEKKDKWIVYPWESENSQTKQDYIK